MSALSDNRFRRAGFRLPAPLLWFIVVVVAALLQATWLEAITMRGVLPDLLLLLTVFAAIYYTESHAMLVGALGGLLHDVARNTTLGHHVLCLVLVGYAGGRIATRLVTHHPAVQAGLVFLASLVYGLLYQLVAYMQDPHSGIFEHVVSNVVPAAFYTAVITPFVFFLLVRIFRRYPVQGDMP